MMPARQTGDVADAVVANWDDLDWVTKASQHGCGAFEQGSLGLGGSDVALMEPAVAPALLGSRMRHRRITGQHDRKVWPAQGTVKAPDEVRIGTVDLIED